MSAPVKYPGLVRAQHGAPGPASGVTYDVDILLPDGGVISRPGVKPSGIRPPEDIDVAPLTDPQKHKLVEVWNINESWYYDITEYPHTAECPGGAPLIDQILSAITQATPGQKQIIARAVGVAVG